MQYQLAGGEITSGYHSSYPASFEEGLLDLIGEGDTIRKCSDTSKT